MTQRSDSGSDDDSPEGLEFVAVVSGQGRRIICPARLHLRFEAWMTGMHRPNAAAIHGVLQFVADRSSAELLGMRKFWRFECRGNCVVYAVVKDQVRICCGTKGNDIVILAWDTKQRQKAVPAMLVKAQKVGAAYGCD